MNITTKQISINVPQNILTELGDIALALGRPRSEVILHAVRTALPSLRQQASRTIQQRQILEREFGVW